MLSVGARGAPLRAATAKLQEISHSNNQRQVGGGTGHVCPHGPAWTPGAGRAIGAWRHLPVLRGDRTQRLRLQRQVNN